MVDSEGDVSETTRDLNAKIVCDSCKRPVKTELKCDMCPRQYHPACLVRLRGAKTLGIGQVSCPFCAAKMVDDVTKDALLRENEVLNRLVLTMMENHDLLNNRIVDIEAKNRDLLEEIRVLKENCNVNKPPALPLTPVPLTLGARRPGQSADSDSQLTHSVNYRDEESGVHNLQKPSNSINNKNKNKQNQQIVDSYCNERKSSSSTEDCASGHLITNSQVDRAVNRAMAQTILPKYIHHNSKGYSPTLKDKKGLVNKGSAPNSGSAFRGVPGKKWLFLGRVDCGADRRIVFEHIKEKAKIPNDSLLVVEELPSKANSKSFKVGICESFYDTLNDSSFWPSNIIFRPFMFRNTRKTNPPNSETNPRNFQVPHLTLTNA